MDPFLLGEIAQQVKAFGGVRGDEGRTRQIDHAGDLLGDLRGARLSFEDAKNLQPGEVARHQQQDQQQHRAPQQALR